MARSRLMIPPERIQSRILLVRGRRVMLDADLAELYGVTTKALNQAVKRNAERFPEDFMFRLSPEEVEALRSQIVTSRKGGTGGSRSQIVTLKRGKNIKYRPYAFTEHGAVMLANVLRSPVAVQAGIQVVRAFVRLRELLVTHKDLARKLREIERKYDKQFVVVFEAIRQLMEPPPEEPKGRMGFRPKP